MPVVTNTLHNHGCSQFLAMKGSNAYHVAEMY